MKRGPLQQYLLAGFSAALLELPFPLAGPLPYWRTFFAWLGLVPLLLVLLRISSVAHPQYLRRSAFLAYLTGILWYLGNCYWIFDTMYTYGGLSPVVAVLILLGFSLILGLYFALFGLGIALIRKGSGSEKIALLAAPVLWTALEFAASRITCVPWDQLGYSQIDNFALTALAPWTGVYGISAVLVGANALLAWSLLRKDSKPRLTGLAVWAVIVFGLMCGHMLAPAPAPTQALAVLVQPNLSVRVSNDWVGPEWDRNLGALGKLSKATCGEYIGGIPEAGAPATKMDCSQAAAHPDLIAWPEAPSPFREEDPAFRKLMADLAAETGATVVAGNQATDANGSDYRLYNAASIFAPDGRLLGRYEKIHLVPFGEYVPFKNLLFFAGHLTQNVSDFSRGEHRKVFRSGGHYYSVFICYESVFADEVRRFAVMGADVFVNISDDAWYGDTSAPWQHLNIARMRAVENRRWILRDTNDGVTAAIDPFGRVTASTPRHERNSLAVRYGFRDDITFYSSHGDLFAMLCAIIALAATGKAGQRVFRSYRQRFQVKSGSR